MQTISDSGSQGQFLVKNFRTNVLAAQFWGVQTFQEWKSALTIAEHQAIIDYKKELCPHERSYYVNINNTLRGKGTFIDGNRVRYVQIHNALGKSYVPSDVIVYRAISHNLFKNIINNGSFNLRDNGFMSCSLVSNNSFTRTRDVIMRLIISEGTKGAYIGNIGCEFKDECELLLDCGSAIFITNTIRVLRSTITGYHEDIDMITLVEGVVES